MKRVVKIVLLPALAIQKKWITNYEFIHFWLNDGVKPAGQGRLLKSENFLTVELSEKSSDFPFAGTYDLGPTLPPILIDDDKSAGFTVRIQSDIV